MQFLTQGGLLVYKIEEVEDVKDAIVDFVDNPRDPKAAIVAAFRYFYNPGGEQVRSPVRSLILVVIIYATVQINCPILL